MINKKINILHLEDNPIDAEIIQAFISNENIDYDIICVDNKEDFISYLEKEEFDIILSDYILPEFDGISALKIVKEKFPDIPFIFTSGSIGEEFAVEAVKCGATDYVLKDKLSKLVISIERALKETEEIKKRKEAEEEHKRLITAIEQIEEYVIIVDLNRKIQYVNPSFEKLTGYTAEEAIGKEVTELLKSGKHSDDFYRDMWNTLQAGEVWRGKIINKKKDGTFFDSEGTNTPVRDSSGKIINYVYVRRDITKELIIQKQINQAQKMEAIGTLAGGIAHDFNNILWGIMGYVELIQMSTPDEQLKNFAATALKACDRGKDLVKQILTFSRQTEQERKPVQLSFIVKEALKFLRSSLPTTIDIEQNIKSKGMIMGDPTQIHQVMLNLCTNASHAMKKNDYGVLKVLLEDVLLTGEELKRFTDLKEEKYIKLTVSDTGHGMDKLTMDRIFEPFFTTKEIGEGTGLGMSVVHGIVKTYGGAITVQSEINKGTTFELYFPVIDNGEGGGAISQAKEIPTGTERILLVDDDQELAKMINEKLTRLGYKVSISISSIDALKEFCLKHDEFDLVVTDYTMPRMTGVELAKKLLEVRPSIPIIMCSGSSQVITQESVRNIGIKALLMKPVALIDMAETIRKVLDE